MFFIQAALMFAAVTIQAQNASDTATFVSGIYQNRINPEDPVKQHKPGILIIGSGEDIRVVSAFSGNPQGGTAYTSAVNN